MNKAFDGFYSLLALYQKIEGQEAYNVTKKLFTAPVQNYKEETVFKIKNHRMAGKTILIGNAPFIFNSEGIASVQETYIRECGILLKRPGFSLLEDKTIGKRLIQSISGEFGRKEVGDKIEEKLVTEEVDKFIRQSQQDIAKKSRNKRDKKEPERETVDLDSMVEDVSPRYPADEKSGIEDLPKKKRGRPKKKKD